MSDSARAVVRPIPAGDLVLSSLQLPEDGTYMAVDIPGPWFVAATGQQWPVAYRWMGVGRVVDELGCVGRGAGALAIEDRGVSCFAEIWAERVFHLQEQPYLEALWRPEWGEKRFALQRINPAMGAEDLRRFWRGRNLVRVIENLGGRPLGHGVVMPLDEFYRRVIDEHRPGVTQEQMAESFAMTYETFRTNLKRAKKQYGLHWPPSG